MDSLPENYRRLVALGIDSSANLPDLNDMTDRGKFPLKPWTASKTVGTMKLIQDYKIRDEETFVRLFQKHSKIPLEILTDQVYEHQRSHFGHYKYDKETIFKYTYCCVVLNSLQGNNTEKAFDEWARTNGIRLRKPDAILDQKFHTDRLKYSDDERLISFISIKPNSFSHNFLQYKDVFMGLQAISDYTGVPWEIYFRDGDSFSLINIESLSDGNTQKIKEWAKGIPSEEFNLVRPILDNLTS